ncbi:Mg2+ transporter protein CorA-like/Zinc transport protein ZntB [Penicillium angulare]|uniref:Mg2+ transporter protein CorA-like/Zinc transport protein ZntB n=1 Tax=Penicillium angulare TaxID=116970 RepID=UPI00253F71C2|nr:Mg2+ transporter protein CorA-like/Zinc transport protein ZntB [Penicillium angulare]KAJ5280836.1 Mg2+ transporter protein CorA-like/Zinc transport protein ZntB [Penicillium angulare]
MADPPDDRYLYGERDREEERMKEAILGANAAAVEKLLLCDPDVLEAVFDFSFPDSEDFVTEGLTPLILAAGLGYYTISKLLLAKGANIYAETTSCGTNAFLLACVQGHLEIAKLILDVGGPCLLELCDMLKRTPLMLASLQGAFEACQFLLGNGADIDKRDPKGFTVLHFATTGGYLDVAKLLLETKGGLLDLQTENIETALLLAAECGKSDVFHYLLGRKADVTVRASGQNTALHLAVKGGALDIVESLLNNNLLENELLTKGLQEKGTSVLELPNARGSTPILIAADGGNSDVFQYLLGKGADITVIVSYGHTILHLAAGGGNLDIVQTLLRTRSDFLEVRNEFEETPLFLAAENGEYDVFSCLLEANADVTARDYFENSILHAAADGGNLGIVKAILEQKSEFLELSNDDGDTPLLAAVKFNKLEVADFLLSQGANIDIQGENGEKLFRTAAGYGSLGMVQKLLDDRHELLELPSENDETPLLIAAKKSRLEVVKLLCRNRADINTQDAWGRTPLSLAIQSGAIPVVKHLLSNGADPNILDYNGNNSFHAACYYGSIYMTKILFDFLANHTQEDGLRTAITARDDDGDAPLYDAVRKERNDPSVVFLLLESEVYFPRNPAQQRGCLASTREKESLSPWLCKLINERASTLSQSRMRAIIYWALLNGDVGLATLASKAATPIKLDRKGATWMHVVALVGNTKMLSIILSWKSRILEEMGTNNKVTPMSIAVKEGNTKMVREFLNHLDHTNCLEVLVQVPKQEESLIWHAAVNRRIQCEDLLWDRLFKIAKEQEDAFQFSHPHSQNAELIMGLAAWRYTTGETKHINRLMHHVEGVLKLPASASRKRTPLQFIVGYKFPVALWWLLSSRLYFGESHLAKGKSSMFKWTRPSPPEEKKARDLIRGLLSNSPPERPRLNFETPSLEFQFQTSDHDWQWATVLDLTIREQKVTVQFAQSSMSQIVYGKGPDEIMRENKNYNLQEIQHILFDKTPVSRKEKARAKRRPGDNSTTDDLGEGEKGRDDREPGRGPQRKIRWIHIPANNV